MSRFHEKGNAPMAPKGSNCYFPKEYQFRPATDDDAPAIRALFALSQKEYGFEYDFNGRESDLMQFPGVYEEPEGFFGVLWDVENDTLAGMAAIRKADTKHVGLTDELKSLNNVAELCRVYLYPEYRGQGLGRKLTLAMIDKARCLGYGTLILESHSALIEALRMYSRLGFEEIPPYTPDEPDYSDFAAKLNL